MVRMRQTRARTSLRLAANAADDVAARLLGFKWTWPQASSGAAILLRGDVGN
jgi:hypothetical protein